MLYMHILSHMYGLNWIPPSLSSIAIRGEWSQGKVFDIYLKFCALGDHYLGRVVSGLNPSKSNFGVLPPHFTMTVPMDDGDVKEAMSLMFGRIMEKYEGTEHDPTGTLLFCLASVVYHADWLKEWHVKDPSHPFSALPILNQDDLLQRLKLKVTLDPTPMMPKATGIPPHVENLVLLEQLLTNTEATLARFESLLGCITSTIRQAFEDNAESNGHVSRDVLMKVFDGFKTEMRAEFKTLKEDFETMDRQMNNDRPEDESLENDGPIFDGHEEPEACQPQEIQPRRAYRRYTHGGKMFYWHVPKNFSFPSDISRANAFRMWLVGMPDYEYEENGKRICAPIRPFRKFERAMLPTTNNVRSQFVKAWKPLFHLMELGVELPACTDTLGADEVNELFDTAALGLDHRVSYIRSNPKLKPNKWNISTWAKYTGRSYILKYGSAEDKECLPDETIRNKKRQIGLKRKRGKGKKNKVLPRRKRGGIVTVQANTTAAATVATQTRVTAATVATRANEIVAATVAATVAVHRMVPTAATVVQPRSTFAAAFGGEINHERVARQEADLAKRQEEMRLAQLKEKGAGKCAIARCNNEEMPLRPMHKCSLCKKLVHHKCAMDKGLVCDVTDLEFCSEVCKKELVM